MENNRSACRRIYICSAPSDPYSTYANHKFHCSCAVGDKAGVCIHRSLDKATGLVICDNQAAWPDSYGNTTVEAKILAKLVDRGLINFESENN